MRRIWILSLVVLTGCTEAAENLPGWTTDYEAAVNNSKRSQRPLLLDFGATWCGPCKKLEATTFKDREVSAVIQNGYVAVKIDVDRNPELASKYGVKSYPTIVLVAPDGREIARRSGYVDAGPFLQWITPHRARNAAEVSSAVSSVVSNISGVTEAAREAERNATATQTNARGLSEMSGELQALLKKD
jgi:thioredoxin-like negative regulator of GroEL